MNVYNPEEGGGRVVSDYAVEGFPTKVIVSPEGKIRNITSGENPAFFDILSELISEEMNGNQKVFFKNSQKALENLVD